MASFENLSDTALAEEITLWAGRVAAGQARLVGLIGDFDRREAWSGAGMLSCAHWLSLHVGMGLKAAHERVRVARVLSSLPVTEAAFAAGRLSWSQVRAITRVATAADEQTYVDLARHATGAQLERLVRGVRRARRIVEDEADPEAAAYRMRTRIRYDADGTLVLSVRMPAEQGAVLLAAIEQARTVIDRHTRQAAGSASGSAEGQSSAEESPPIATTDAEQVGSESSAEDPAQAGRVAPASVADAVLHLAGTFLQVTAAQIPGLARRQRSQLVAHIDPLSGWVRLPDGEFLPPVTVPAQLRSTISSVRLRPLTDADLGRADLGRTAREPTLALRELIGSLDGERCRFPGCTRHRRLHAHHVQYWSAGGRTDLANLILVCARHHTLIHTRDFSLTLHADRTLTITRSDGVPIRHHLPPPWQPAEHLDPAHNLTPATLPPAATDRLHLHYAVSVLMQQAA